jgi:hypothetical protein
MSCKLSQCRVVQGIGVSYILCIVPNMKSLKVNMDKQKYQAGIS